MLTIFHCNPHEADPKPVNNIVSHQIVPKPDMSCPAPLSMMVPRLCDNIGNVLQSEARKIALTRRIDMWREFLNPTYGHQLPTPV